MDKILITFSTVISSVITWLIVPKIRDIGLRFNLIDMPEKRKQHRVPIVRLGGIAIFLGFVISYIVLIGLGNNYLSYPLLDKRMQVMLVGASLFFILGLTDDLLNLSAFKRLICQFSIASFIVSQGFIFKSINLSIFNQYIPPLTLSYEIGFLLTLFWIVAITNAINWIDGLDGLAAGISIITSLGFFIVGIINHDLYSCSLSGIVIGSCIGFLKYNKYPSIIVMGDGGSYFLGFIISLLGIIFNYSSNEEYNSTLFTGTIFFILLFVGDMVFVILRRIILNKSPFFPDRNHLHHRLLSLGFSHSNTVYLMYLMNLILVIIGIIISIKSSNLLFK